MNRIVHHPRRKARQERAVERQEARNNRTAKEQLALIQERRGKSSKESAKLLSLLSEESVV